MLFCHVSPSRLTHSPRPFFEKSLLCSRDHQQYQHHLGAWQKSRVLSLAPNLLNQDPHLNNILKWFWVCRLKCERRCSVRYCCSYSSSWEAGRAHWAREEASAIVTPIHRIFPLVRQCCLTFVRVPTQMDRTVYCLIRFQIANINNLDHLTTPANIFASLDLSVL